jgi:transcriptional repressor NrdR
MKVVKRSGYSDELSLEKVKTSIMNSADDINYTLTESDLNVILTVFKELLDMVARDANATSVYELRGLILESLTRNGFSQVAKSYIDFYIK